MANKLVNHYITLLFAIATSLTNSLISQSNKENYLSFDVHITDKKTIQFLDSIQVKVLEKIPHFRVYSSDIRMQYTYSELKRIIDNFSLSPSSSYRFSLIANDDLSKFSIFGFSQNYMIKSSEIFGKLHGSLQDIFELDPIWVMPLSNYKEFLTPDELNRFVKIIFENFKRHLPDNHQFDGNNVTPLITHKINEDNYFNYLIRELPYEIEYGYFYLYKQPDKQSRTNHKYFFDNDISVTKRKVSVNDSSFYLHSSNVLSGFFYNIEYSFEVDFSTKPKDSFYETPLIIKVSNKFIGLCFDNFELIKLQGEFIKKVVWIEKESLIQHINNDYFKHFIEINWKDKLFMKMKLKN